ncbi:uncharacterized protein TNCV_3384601 [Trichonephila clavipes]|uniref:Uncharacterized protein n=1 Tax=Trichonephila clavipes TaxID=2585209 RepID=A0A8X6SYT0_TRICX|nr:uncharacterized protein TNCV_3384601 [Trichonephila clavipes]
MTKASALEKEYNAYEPAGATFLVVGVPILQSASVLVVGCSPDDVRMLQYVSPKHPTRVRWHLNLGSILAIRVISSLSSSSSTARARCGHALLSIKNEVWDNGTSEKTHMGKKYLFTISTPDYRPSIENVELCSSVQDNASPDKNTRTTVMVSFLDVTGIKPCLDLSPNQNTLRIASSTEPTLIRTEDTTPITVAQFLCSLHHYKL